MLKRKRKMEFILAQVFGGIALAIVCVGYFLKSKGSFMITQVVANVFYSLAFFVVGEFVGGSLVCVSIARCVYIYIAEKVNFKYMLHFLPIFIASYIALTVIFWGNAFDIMPLIASTIFTIGYVLKDLQKMRILLIFPNAILVAYNILTTTYVSALLDFIEVIVIVVAILKFHFEAKKIENRGQVDIRKVFDNIEKH